MTTNPELHVIGVVHSDPLGPKRLRSHLQFSLNENTHEPAFVAVEWDEELLQKVISQRGRLSYLCRARWSLASDEFIEALTLAMGYEGDTHQQLVSDVSTVWLDQGRDLLDPVEVDRFAELRMRAYAKYASGIDKLTVSALDPMSVAAWEYAPAREEGPDPRDDKFARGLYEALKDTTQRWAIAIMGINHVSSSAGSAVDLLMHNGVFCKVTSLDPR